MSRQYTPLQAIRRYCLWCCLTPKGVQECDIEECPLWPFRCGRKNAPVAPSRLRAIRKCCLDCVGGSPKDVKNCFAMTCPLYRFLFGKNPALKGKRGKGNADALLAYREKRVAKVEQ